MPTSLPPDDDDEIVDVEAFLKEKETNSRPAPPPTRSLWAENTKSKGESSTPSQRPRSPAPRLPPRTPARRPPNRPSTSERRTTTTTNREPAVEPKLRTTTSREPVAGTTTNRG